MPAALWEWLPDDHLAYFISDVVDQLDLSEITALYERESRGGPPYHPRMMVKVASARLLRRGGVLPTSRPASPRGHSLPGTGSEQHARFPHNLGLPQGQSGYTVGPVPAGIGVVCQQAGLVKLGHVALDGTKVRANASKHRAMSYGRMREKEEQLSAEVEELLRRA